MCLSAALNQLIDISTQGGIATKVRGKSVIGKVWIHYIIGDTQGNNDLLGHYNGSGKLQRPYRDCKCSYGDMDHPNPSCEYITRKEMKEATDRMRASENITAKRREKRLVYLCQMMRIITDIIYTYSRQNKGSIGPEGRCTALLSDLV